MYWSTTTCTSSKCACYRWPRNVENKTVKYPWMRCIWHRNSSYFGHFENSFHTRLYLVHKLTNSNANEPCGSVSPVLNQWFVASVCQTSYPTIRVIGNRCIWRKPMSHNRFGADLTLRFVCQYHLVRCIQILHENLKKKKGNISSDCIAVSMRKEGCFNKYRCSITATRSNSLREIRMIRHYNHLKS